MVVLITWQDGVQKANNTHHLNIDPVFKGLDHLNNEIWFVRSSDEFGIQICPVITIVLWKGMSVQSTVGIQIPEIQTKGPTDVQ